MKNLLALLFIVSSVYSTEAAEPFKTGTEGKVAVFMNDYYASTGDEISIPLRVKDFINITGYQFSLNWNPEVLEFIETENKNTEAHFGTTRIADGLLMVSWFLSTTQPVTLNDEEELFELKFRVKGERGTNSEIEIMNGPVRSEAYDQNLQLMDIATTNGSVKVGDVTEVFQSPSSQINLSVQPNPFSNSANIIFTVAQENHVQIVIYDLLGKQMKKIEADFSAGKHQIEWSSDEAGNPLAEGLYHVRMQAKNFSKAVTAVLVR